MNKDIRLDLSFSNHRKRKKLLGLLGPQGILSLIDLWMKTAENRPKGILTGMDETDIALDAQWAGDPQQFCRALIETGFLDRDQNGSYLVHDWKEHQRYAYFAEERSKVARDAAQKRWERRRGIKTETKEKQGHNADIIQDVCKEHTKGNAPSPSPSPSPSPNPLKTLSSSSMTCPHEAILETYHKILPELPKISKWTPERLKKLLAFQKRDSKRQDPMWWEKYFQAVRESSFLLGGSTRGWRANIDWLLKEANFIKVKEGHHADKKAEIR